jgi:aryl-alcohol dehydrogenase-like predicted oxidoreductase
LPALYSHYLVGMRYRKLGRSGVEVSEIGVGAWAIGGSMWGGARDDDSRAALERAIERGVNLIDTALVYGQGHSEKIVGDVLKRHPEVLVATKVPPKSYNWPAQPDARLEDNFPAAWIRQSCEDSLAHLQRDHIDLLQLHVWADSWTLRDEWYGEMVKLREQGKIRLIGISINSHDPKSAVRVVKAGRVDALQVFYNLFDQSPEDELYPACLEHGVGILARVPFDEGSLTGKLRADTKFPEGDFRSEYFAGNMLKKTVERVEKMRPVVEGAAGTMARGALRFCLSHPAVSTVIPGMRNLHQADENTAASDEGPLPAEVLSKLREFRWVRNPY